MSLIINALGEHAAQQGDRVALRGKDRAISYAELARAVDALARELKQGGAKVVGLVGDNLLSWAIADLACLQAGLATVPIPVFFSAGQRQHALGNAGVDTLLTPHPEALPGIAQAVLGARVDVLDVAGLPLGRVAFGAGGPRSDELLGFSKVTYTSGTTGQPKGVKFTSAALEAVVTAAVSGIAVQAQSRFIALLPMSVLMENLLGLYVALVAGAEYIALPMAELGFRGSSRLEIGALLASVRQYRATNMICTPQVLQNLVVELERGAEPLPDLEYVGAGGALIAESLLERAARLGLPIYQGWGLSECASAVTFNKPGANRVGSVGRPLSHVQVRRADDGELLVAGRSLFAGYVGEALRSPEAWYATGDLGEIDADGYVRITGRKKTLIINSFGRNVSPEWVETQLTSRAALSQAAVFGDGRPYLVGVVVPAPHTSRETLTEAIEATNRELPDYAKLSRWVVAETPFTVGNEQLSVLGKLRREHIGHAY
ncbi:MAG TPA: AMP-binding protein, partial [Polyangiaceae bacterium]|nr:AMP-binding protein [Polyangiaceae bacterium]